MGIFSKISSAAKKVVSKIAKPNGPNSGFSNVVATVKAAVSGKGVVANTKSATVNKVLGTVASHPFATAAVAGTIANIPKAVSVVKGLKASKAAKAAKSVVSKPISEPGLIKPAAGGLISPSAAQNKVQPSSPGLITSDTVAGGAYTGTTSSAPRKASSKRRKSSSTRRRKSPRRSHASSRSRRRSKRHYGTAKQYARKGGKSVHYAKNGTPYIILANGRARFIKGKHR